MTSHRAEGFLEYAYKIGAYAQDQDGFQQTVKDSVPSTGSSTNWETSEMPKPLRNIHCGHWNTWLVQASSTLLFHLHLHLFVYRDFLLKSIDRLVANRQNCSRNHLYIDAFRRV